MPYYYTEIVDPEAKLDSIHKTMFDLNGGYQLYLENNAKPLGARDLFDLIMHGALYLIFDLIAFNALRIFGWVISRPFGAAGFANQFNASSFIRAGYREGIQHSYQVLPNSQTGETLKIKRGFREKSAEATQLLVLTPNIPPVTTPEISRFVESFGLPSFVFNATMRPPHPKAPVDEWNVLEPD